MLIAIYVVPPQKKKKKKKTVRLEKKKKVGKIKFRLTMSFHTVQCCCRRVSHGLSLHQSRRATLATWNRHVAFVLKRPCDDRPGILNPIETIHVSRVPSQLPPLSTCVQKARHPIFIGSDGQKREQNPTVETKRGGGGWEVGEGGEGAGKKVESKKVIMKGERRER